MIPTIRRHVLPTLLAGILLLSLGATTTSHAPTAHDAAKKRVLVVYYFYHTVRCAACISIEKMTDEVLRGQFGNELRSGRILWKPTNLDLEKTDALEKHYNLEVQTLILSDTKTG